MTALVGTPPRGASVTSGVISTFTAITAGHITINTVAMPALGAAADAATRTQDLVDAINSMFSVTGVRAVRVTATTYSLNASVPIVVAALGGTATLANCGLTAGTTAVSSTPLLTSRKAHGSSAAGSDAEVVLYGGNAINVKHAKAMGLLDRVGSTDVEIAPAAAYTRVG